MYYSKNECYEDTMVSLSTGIIQEEDVRHLLEYYKDIEFYECCQGLVEAFKDYKQIQNGSNRKNRENKTQ